MIYSIGYQRLSLDALKGIMRKHRIDRLVDIRSKPYSRRAEFNKRNLMRLFGNYVWRGDVLGGLHGPVSLLGIDWILKRQAEGLNLLIMCMEHNPDDCHRKYDIAKRLEPHGIKVQHIILGNNHPKLF